MDLLRAASSSRARPASQGVQSDPPTSFTSPRKVRRRARFAGTATLARRRRRRVRPSRPRPRAEARHHARLAPAPELPRTASPAPFCVTQISIMDMLREEQERAERAEKAKAASHSGASRDVRGVGADRRQSDARSALRTPREENLDADEANVDNNAVCADESPHANRAKLWNEEELEHVMEDVAVRHPKTRIYFFDVAPPLGCPLSFLVFVFYQRVRHPRRFLASAARARRNTILFGP